MRTYILTLMTLVGLALFAPPAHADAFEGDHWFCPLSWRWDQVYVPVFIHPDLPGLMWHPNGEPWTRSELQADVQFYLERFNDQSGSNHPPLVFIAYEDDHLGRIPAWDSPAPTSRSIVIRPNLLAPGMDVEIDECSTYASFKADGSGAVRIFFQTSPVCGAEYEHQQINYRPAFGTFGGTLMHELSHAMGFGHWTDCHPDGMEPLGGCQGPPADVSCGLQNNGGVSFAWTELTFDDVYGMREKYGTTRGSMDYHMRTMTSDGQVFETLSAGAGGGTVPQLGHFIGGGHSEGGLAFPPLVGLDSDHEPHLHAILTGGTEYPTHFVDYGKTESVTQFGQMGSTFSSFTGTAFWYTFYMSAVSVVQTVLYPRFRHQNAPNFGNGTVGTDGRFFQTIRSGHTGDFDPKSGQLVHVWRSEDSSIRLALSDGDGGAVSQPLQIRAFKAAYTPSIACGDPSILYNCIMVWAHQPTRNEAFYRMRVAQFRVTGDPVVPIDFRVQFRELGYLQYGPPSIGYKGPAGGDDAFIVAWKYPNGCFSTSRLGASIFNGLDPSDEVVHCNQLSCDPGTPSITNCVQLGPPTVTTDEALETAEVWVVGNDFFTFPQ